MRELLGRQPLVEELRGGGFRITTRVVEQPDAEVAEAVFRALRGADRFGHTRGDRWESLWAEVDGPEVEPRFPTAVGG
ncbi:hypothetical protein [Kitasatospora phosalacinea]|uniref:hypothetical protein n=1 Tax=Kitasatospora phosalacinea TaxID=2065 RepID=UPI000526A561|nr:hypothetical protein [Kitasatospora phosalacinea]